VVFHLALPLQHFEIIHHLRLHADPDRNATGNADLRLARRISAFALEGAAKGSNIAIEPRVRQSRHARPKTGHACLEKLAGQPHA
jgi:hypothetical protein